MLTIHGSSGTRSLRAVWTAEELGIDYDYISVSLARGEQRSADFLTLNPIGKVPLLVDGDLVIGESGAICTYLADNHPESGLIPPPGTPERARHDRWCYFVIGELEQPLWTLAKHSFALPEKARVPAVKDTARWEFQKAAKVLAAGLGDRAFAVGEGLTVADIFITHCLSWARGAKVEIEYPELIAYRDRHLARPAVARARARENRSD